MSKRKKAKQLSFNNFKVIGWLILGLGAFSIVSQLTPNFIAAMLLAALIGLAGYFGLRIRGAQKASKQKEKERAALAALGVDNALQLSPVQYEKFCGLLLEAQGWRVTFTAVTGDKGADIIASKQAKPKTVFQCKQWTNSVGVASVQEVHAAKAYYEAEAAVVVSTAKYTKGAIELAAKTGVILLSDKELTAY